MKQPSKAGFTMTREVRASEAKTQFGRLLDAVERGETIVLTRRGRRVARLVPEAEGTRPKTETARQKKEIAEAIADIKALGKEIREKHGPMTIEEILSLRHEGHKY